MSSTNESNLLKNEKSAYLKQHADNPVNWMPYTQEALEMAQKQNKPILLSIGYSSCHWCHVMAHESFEDVKTAQIINDNFIAIKVDKEEMPDLDQYYQTVCQLMSGTGGWPLNIFLTPKLRPFFAGTYFPKIAKQNMISFSDVLEQLAQSYRDNAQAVESNAQKLIDAAGEMPRAKQKIDYPGHFPAAASVLGAVSQIADKKNGGYGKAPKFAQFSFLEYSIEQILEGVIEQELGEHIILSVEKILMGGIYDHARGGIHRYSVDEAWLIPHFEKMLYDQAALLRVLVKTSLIYPSPLILDALTQTLNYLDSEMLSDQGYFFSAQDADSEGVEGLYFTFTQEELIDAVTKEKSYEDQKLHQILSWFKTKEEGNFHSGLNTIALNEEKKNEFYLPENWALIRQVRQALLFERKKRIPPMTDNKGVAAWNFMLLSSLIDVVQYCRVEQIKLQASTLLQKVVTSIHKTFISQGEGDNKSTIRTSSTRNVASDLFEDYVFFADAQLRLYEISGNETFRQNGIETLIFIAKNFTKDGTLYTRKTDEELDKGFANIPAQLFDQSHRSAFGSYLLMCRKWSLCYPELSKLAQDFAEFTAQAKQLSLQNPLGFGELLRALTYPDEAFKKLEVPMQWLKENRLSKLFINFSARFVLTYTSKDEWQICNHNSCEFQGKTFEEFERVFKGKEKDEATQNN